MALIDNRGRQIPFFVNNYTLENIATANFDPITSLHDAIHAHPTEMNASRVGVYSRGGFLVRPDTDGALYGITWDAYKNNKIDGSPSLTGLLPQKFLGLANTWIECPFVKIYSKADGTYPSTSTEINVAPLS
jgi:hypothetical protein